MEFFNLQWKISYWYNFTDGEVRAQTDWVSCSRSGVVSGGRGTETCVCSAPHCPCRLEHTCGEGGSAEGASAPWMGCGRGRRVRWRIGQSYVGMRDKWACGVRAHRISAHGLPGRQWWWGCESWGDGAKGRIEVLPKTQGQHPHLHSSWWRAEAGKRPWRLSLGTQGNLGPPLHLTHYNYPFI